MEKQTKKSNTERRAFIIIENAGIMLGEKNSELSHMEILTAAGIASSKAEKIIKKNPRGYFKDENLIFYQGNFEPLDEDNIKLVRKYADDFIKLFQINADTKFFRSNKQSALVTSWTPIHKSEDQN